MSGINGRLLILNSEVRPVSEQRFDNVDRAEAAVPCQYFREIHEVGRVIIKKVFINIHNVDMI